VDIGESLAVFYTDREHVLASARERIAKTFTVSSTLLERKSMIFDIVDNNGVRKWK